MFAIITDVCENNNETMDFAFIFTLKKNPQFSGNLKTWFYV